MQKRLGLCLRQLVLSVACAASVDCAMAAELALSGVVGGRALLVVDNGPPQWVALGKSTGAIRLLSLDDNVAVVEYEGRRQTLRLGERVVRQASTGAGRAGVGTLTGDEARKVLARGVELTIEADDRGQFVTDGEVNGRSVRFLVDTGASIMAIGQSTARAMRIDLDDGQLDRAHTAGGVVGTWRVTLRSVKIGGIRFEHVDAVVMETDMPYALLGMNILGQMEMRRDGRLMRLKKKL